MKLSRLVRTSAEVAGTRSRKAKIALLAELLVELEGDDVEIGVAFLSGELRQGKVGVGWALVRDARPDEAAAAASLALADVDAACTELQSISGAGSKARRTERLRALFAAAAEDEQAFLGKLMVGELRQGALEGILLEGVAAAAGLDAARVRRAAMLGGSLRDVATAAMTAGEAGLDRFALEVLRPLQPMLAGTGASAAEVLGKLGRAAFEWKLDGARLQVHRRGDVVRAFTRRLHDVTRAVPEVVETVAAFDAQELILDGEVIAFAPDGRPQPFQVTMSRFGRKLNVDEQRARTPLTPVFFDALLVDGVELLDLPGEQRWEALARLVPEELRVQRMVTGDADEAEAFFAEALDRGHEGLVAKALDAGYEAGRRGAKWLKLKPAHTLDLVVLAAEWGSGRREGWLSNLHLGARDPAGGFVMLGKTFKGMTDETLKRQTAELLAIETRREDYVVHVRPEKVVEIAFDGIQASPHYPGGVALRFARLKRYRDDKTAAEADTIDAVRALGDAR
ncbi:MAG: ATP-dependent DNA ligase [Planctomycetota bacterium]